MNAPLKTECPECLAVMKLKSKSSFGRKVNCPKCSSAFVIQPITDSDLNELPVSPESVRVRKKKPVTSGKAKKKPGKDENSGWSLTTVFIALFILFSFFSWAYMAAQYGQHQDTLVRDEGGEVNFGREEEFEGGRFRRGRAVAQGVRLSANSFKDFIINAFTQIPNMGNVISFCFTQRLGVMILITLFQSSMLVIAVVLKVLDQKLETDNINMPD